MVEIKIPGTPLPWKAPFVSCKGAWSVRTPILNQLRSHLKSTYDLKVNIEPLAVDFVFLMPIPKATSKKQKLLMLSGKIRPSKRPDRTNCLKFAEDILNEICFVDDNLVVDGRVAKYYSETPMTIVRIYTVEEYNTMNVPLWRPQ